MLPPIFEFNEETSGQILGTLVGEDGVTPLPGSTLTTLTATLYPEGDPGTPINGRSDQSILNANGGTIDEFGAFVFTLAPADNALINPDLPDERHILLLQWTWGAGLGGNLEIVCVVRNLTLVP